MRTHTLSSATSTSTTRTLPRCAPTDPPHSDTHTPTVTPPPHSTPRSRRQALSAFRAAIHCDPRHYNAWYGLGIIHYRQEKYAVAEGHFRNAVQINACSPVLLCYQGMVQHAQKKSMAALEMLTKALSLDEGNALAHFHKAVVLSALDSDDDALAVLQRLRQIAPRESSVYFLMGKIYKKLGQSDKAAMHFAWAMDLDPRGSQHMARDAAECPQLTDEDIRAAGEPASADTSASDI
eukprot:m.72423 g.72423  ORF g.72423 m.72423 type:complete len:236 (-) comp7679_c0_seq6:166-873(-)